MAIIILLIILALLVTVLITYLMRGTVINRIRTIGEDQEIPYVTSPMFHQTHKLLTETPLHQGNKVELLLNGDETFPRLWEDLRAARHTITIHVFLYHPGKLADQLRDILAERAWKGVKVFIMFDAFGAWGMSRDYRQSLEAAGAEVGIFRPLRLKSLYKVQQRMHARAVIIDARIGYTGGFGIADEWLGDGRQPNQWRDTNVRLQGPVVNQLQAIFCANWVEATGDLLVGRDIFRLDDAAAAGTQEAGIMNGTPSLGSTNAERLLVLSISAARQRLYITNAYFVPNKDFRLLLMEAAKRGVDVRVLTPGNNTDQLPTWHAARAHYEELLAAGVKIYEYRSTMVHAKTLVIDGFWATIGTFNFDNRSMKLNDEVALVMRDETFSAQLEKVFLQDLDYANEVTLQEVRQRTWSDRIKEQACRIMTPIL